MCRRVLLLILLLAGFCAPSLAAPSDPKAAASAEKQGVSQILKTLDWGASSQDVLSFIKKTIEDEYAAKFAETTDALVIDRLLKAKNSAFESVERTFVRFTGQRTGYESSLISGDFLPNNDEAILKIEDDSAQRFFFFKNDRLWKILVAYNSTISRSVPFPEFVRQVEAKYGKPKDQTYQTPPGGQRTVQTALWEDDLTQLVVEDRSEFYGTFAMKFLDKGEGVALERARLARVTPRAADSARAEAVLGDIMGGDDDPSSDSVVDQLTGVQHEVDLSSGRPTYEEPTRVTPEKGKRKKPAKRDKPKAEKPAPTKPAEPVIIY